MTDAEIADAIADAVCLACEGAKRPGTLFCATDQSALPWWMRRAENFRAALAHLKGHAERRRVYARGRSFAWPYTSLGQLADAHYELLADRPPRCRVPRCGQQILFVKAPLTGDVVVINQDDVRPHFTTCADPDWFARQRASGFRLPASGTAVQTPAGTAKRTKKRGTR